MKSYLFLLVLCLIGCEKKVEPTASTAQQAEPAVVQQEEKVEPAQSSEPETTKEPDRMSTECAIAYTEQKNMCWVYIIKDANTGREYMVVMGHNSTVKLKD